MALGQKLGGILGGIGSGLSMVPGPWSAIGAVMNIAGGVATQAGEAKDRKQMEEQREQETNQPTQAAEQPDSSRARAGTPEGIEQDPAAPQPPSRNIIQPASQAPVGGNYQDQMDQAIAQMLTSSGGLYG